MSDFSGTNVPVLAAVAGIPRNRDGSGPRLDTEFGEYAGNMIADCLFADVELCSDLGVVQAAREKMNNLPFTGGQAAE